MQTITIILLAVVISCQGSVLKGPSNRASLILGNAILGDTLLHRSYLYRTAIPNSIQSEDFTYRGYPYTNITSIQVVEIGYTQYATPWVLAGGVGANNVTVRVQSARGYGYYYLVEIWGRY